MTFSTIADLESVVVGAVCVELPTATVHIVLPCRDNDSYRAACADVEYGRPVGILVKTFPGHREIVADLDKRIADARARLAA
ncbi:hypothetical protein [Parvibaculum sp.]|uniref:hypothetical protein n=1 Tax=Parvibaculum sp. TaxID=2024848 RepID=UPI002732A195|nr:hypothetical protein [Parvibaculum sp.]MDP3328764.1 hypothetical protein [Parvibaculum sp.]